MAEKSESGFVLFQDWVRVGQDQEEKEKSNFPRGWSRIGFGIQCGVVERTGLCDGPNLVLSWDSAT